VLWAGRNVKVAIRSRPNQSEIALQLKYNTNAHIVNPYSELNLWWCAIKIPWHHDWGFYANYQPKRPTECHFWNLTLGKLVIYSDDVCGAHEAAAGTVHNPPP